MEKDKPKELVFGIADLKKENYKYRLQNEQQKALIVRLFVLIVFLFAVSCYFGYQIFKNQNPIIFVGSANINEFTKISYSNSSELKSNIEKLAIDCEKNGTGFGLELIRNTDNTPVKAICSSMFSFYPKVYKFENISEVKR